jgi:hypothetical protein
MNDTPSVLTYDNKKYPVIELRQISIKLNDKYNKIIMKFPHEYIEKRIKKIVKFRGGFAFITKKKNPVAAISCFDLALISQYRPKDFAREMQKKLREQNPEQGKILDAYLDNSKHSLKNILGLAMGDSRILNFVDEEDLLQLFIESRENIVQGKQGGRSLFLHLDCAYRGLLTDFNRHKNIGLFYHFASQLEELSTLEFEKNWNEDGATKYGKLCRLLDSQYDVEYILKTIDEFLDMERDMKRIAYFLLGHKHSTLQVMSREIMLYIAQLYPLNL